MYKNTQQFREEAGYEIDGFWVPRVTAIVGIKAKPALYHFYAGLTNFQEGEKIKEISAKQGTMVHEAVQDAVSDKDIDIDPSIKPSVEAALDFIDRNNIKIDPEYIEKRVTNYQEGYSGTIDGLAVINGKFGVLDIKTSQAIYRDYDLQTAAYIAALIDDIPNLQTRWILRIDQNRLCHKCGSTLREKGGKDKIKLPWKPGDWRVRAAAQRCRHEWSSPVGDVELKESPYWQEDYNAFLAAKKLWEWEHAHLLKEMNMLA